jgi:hypothetical protein
MELEEPATLAAGCDGFLAFETIKSDLGKEFPRNPVIGLCVGSTLGVVRSVKRPLFVEERGANHQPIAILPHVLDVINLSCQNTGDAEQYA